METMNTKNLWGKEFRVVEYGLAEVDVIKFVERLMTKLRVAEERVGHLASLTELATQTISSAERFAQEMRDEAEREAHERSEQIIAAGERQALEILQGAKYQAESILAGAERAAQSRVHDLEQTMSAMSQWPEEEFQAIAAVEERIKSFRATFQGLLGLLSSRIDTAPPGYGPRVPTDKDRSLRA